MKINLSSKIFIGLILILLLSFTTFINSGNTVNSNLKDSIFVIEDSMKVNDTIKTNLVEIDSIKEKINYTLEYYQTGYASWYGIGDGYHGKKTASGEIFNTYSMTAAHRTLKFGTLIRVTNEKNGKWVDVVINDRGPFSKGRIIDLSYSAKNKIGMDGVAKVKIEIIHKFN